MAVAEVDFIGVPKVMQRELGKRWEAACPGTNLTMGSFQQQPTRGAGEASAMRPITTLCVVNLGGRSTIERLSGELRNRIFDGIVAILRPSANNHPQWQEEVFRHAKYPSSIRVVVNTDPRSLNPEIVIKHLGSLAEEAEAKKENLTPEYLEASKVIRDPETGRLDAIKIAKYFAVSLSELARIVGISKATLHKTPSSKKSQAALEPFEKIVRLRILLDGDDKKVLGWLNAPNEDLARVNGRHPCPMDIIRDKHPEIIAGVVERAFTGEPS